MPCTGREVRLRCFQKGMVEVRQLARALLGLLARCRVAAMHATHCLLEYHRGVFPAGVSCFELFERGQRTGSGFATLGCSGVGLRVWMGGGSLVHESYRQRAFPELNFHRRWTGNSLGKFVALQRERGLRRRGSATDLFFSKLSKSADF